MKKFILLPGCLMVVLAFSLPGHTASPSGYRVLRKIPMPDIEGWDYLTIDSDARRLFISNNSGIVIVDIDTLRQVGTAVGLHIRPADAGVTRDHRHGSRHRRGGL
jgi:hypothetical protein